MKLTQKQVAELHKLSNIISKMCDNERAEFHNGFEPQSDEIYDYLMSAVDNIQSAIQRDDLLINKLF